MVSPRTQVPPSASRRWRTPGRRSRRAGSRRQGLRCTCRCTVDGPCVGVAEAVAVVVGTDATQVRSSATVGMAGVMLTESMSGALLRMVVEAEVSPRSPRRRRRPTGRRPRCRGQTSRAGWRRLRRHTIHPPGVGVGEVVAVGVGCGDVTGEAVGRCGRARSHGDRVDGGCRVVDGDGCGVAMGRHLRSRRSKGR